ncbi:unnamed protein product [Cuscuta campestris]|uniref:Uncharacterized protein n=1 Tax=Cuscuta campestris TaxID=132261 RepID=A0A484NI66_9ASTE|nr:unnamed protein product [Cuscuta campestris]
MALEGSYREKGVGFDEKDDTWSPKKMPKKAIRVIRPDDEFVERDFRMNPVVINIFSGPPDPLDISGATTITVDNEYIKQMGAYPSLVRIFQEQCLDRRTLQMFDHPGYTSGCSCSGLFHWDKPPADKLLFKNNSEFAMKSCCKLCKKDLRLVSVDKLSLIPSFHQFNYLTFTVIDELSNEHITFQAAILEMVAEDQFLLGLLRDVSHDQVVAVIQIEEGCGERAVSSSEN